MQPAIIETSEVASSRLASRESAVARPREAAAPTPRSRSKSRATGRRLAAPPGSYILAHAGIVPAPKKPHGLRPPARAALHVHQPSNAVRLYRLVCIKNTALKVKTHNWLALINNNEEPSSAHTVLTHDTEHKPATLA